MLMDKIWNSFIRTSPTLIYSNFDSTNLLCVQFLIINNEPSRRENSLREKFKTKGRTSSTTKYSKLLSNETRTNRLMCNLFPQKFQSGWLIGSFNVTDSYVYLLTVLFWQWFVGYNGYQSRRTPTIDETDFTSFRASLRIPYCWNWSLKFSGTKIFHNSAISIEYTRRSIQRL